MLRKKTVSFLILLCIAQPTQAQTAYPDGYKEAKWGMSKKEVMKTLPETKFVHYTALGDELRSEIKMIELPTTLSLYFKEDKFYRAEFSPLLNIESAPDDIMGYVQRKYSELKNALIKKWGPPSAETEYEILDIYSGKNNTVLWLGPESKVVLSLSYYPSRVERFAYVLGIKYESIKIYDEMKERDDLQSEMIAEKSVSVL